MVIEEFTLVKETYLRVYPVILVHAFERFDTYYYRCSNTTQVAGLTSYVIIPDSLTK